MFSIMEKAQKQEIRKALNTFRIEMKSQILCNIFMMECKDKLAS